MPSGSHDINVKLLALMGVISAILVVALIVATQAWFRYEFAQENQRKYIDVPYRQLEELKEAQLADLNAPVGVIEIGGKQVELTAIDQAMLKVIEANKVEQ